MYLALERSLKYCHCFLLPASNSDLEVVQRGDLTAEREPASPEPVRNGTIAKTREDLNDSRHSEHSGIDSRPASVSSQHNEGRSRGTGWPHNNSPIQRSPESSPVHHHSPSAHVPSPIRRERPSFLDRDRSLRHEKEPHSPPNVTVVQPPMNHPMLPYFHPGLYPGLSASHSGLLTTAPHLGAGMAAAGQGIPGLHQFLSPTSAAGGDAHGAFPNAMAAQAAQAAAAWLSMNQGLLLNSHLAALGASNPWNPNLNLGGAFSHHPSRDIHPHAAHADLPHRGHGRPAFVTPARNNSPPRFTPYVIPSKSPEQRRSPLIIPQPEHGRREAEHDRREAEHSRREESVRRDSHREARHSHTERRSPGSDARHSHHTKDKANPVNELRSIERMVNGLDR